MQCPIPYREGSSRCDSFVIFLFQLQSHTTKVEIDNGPYIQCITSSPPAPLSISPSLAYVNGYELRLCFVYSLQHGRSLAYGPGSVRSPACWKCVGSICDCKTILLNRKHNLLRNIPCFWAMTNLLSPSLVLLLIPSEEAERDSGNNYRETNE